MVSEKSEFVHFKCSRKQIRSIFKTRLRIEKLRVTFWTDLAAISIDFFYGARLEVFDAGLLKNTIWMKINIGQFNGVH